MIKIGENQDKDVTYENEPESQRQLFPNIPLTVDVSPLQDAIDALDERMDDAESDIDSIMTTLQTFDGQPGVAETVSNMTDTNKIYVYVGSETGYTSGDWYYYDGTAWVSGGTYVANPVQIDDTLTQAGEAADAKVTGDEIAQLKSDFDALDETVNGVTSQNYTVGKNLSANSVGHAIIDDPNSCITDYIPVTWGTDKVAFFYTDDTTDATTYQIWFFDSNKDFLSFYGRMGTGTNYRGNLSTPSGSSYAVFSFKKGYAGKLTKHGDETTVYYTAEKTVETYGVIQNIGDLHDLETTKNTSLVDAINEVNSKTDILPISPSETTFFHVSKNMADPEKFVTGEYVNQTNGTFSQKISHARTGYIAIEPQTEYVIRLQSGAVGENFRYAFYNKNKVCISGAQGAISDMILTSPENARYIAMSDTVANMLELMISVYIDDDVSFEPYANTYVLNKYIKTNMDDVILNVSEKYYALVGFETNIYFENLTDNWDEYSWDVTCNKGIQLERGFRITPSPDDVGSYTLTIKASLSETVYKEMTTTLIVTSASAGSGDMASVIVLGDSTTYNGIAIGKLHDDFTDDVMSVQTLGTMGTSPNNHEGRSGWNWNDYFTKASITYPSPDPRGTIYNPFYNPTTQTFDADYYFDNSRISKPDYFIINMGINDVFGFSSDAAMESGLPTIIQKCEDAVQSVLDATSTTKVCVCLTIPPNHSQDAFGKAYACSQTRDRCKRNNTLWVKALIDQFKDREDERIYIIPINACLDTVYNMGMEAIPVNARNTTTYQSPIANGGVHPVESGYWQIADVYTAFLKAQVE